MIESIHPELNNKDWLETQLKDKRPAQIARELGVERGSIARAIKRLGLETYQKRSRTPELDDKEWLTNELKTKTYKQIAQEIGSSTGNVADRAYRYGIASPSANRSQAVKAALKKRFPNGRNGELASNWRGGERNTGAGHIYSYSPDHPKANHQGYVMKHRLVVEEQIMRYLQSTEVIHHVDLDKTNNDINNLYLCNTASAHRHAHAQLERTATQLIRNGIIKFNFDTGEYYINETKIN